MKKLVVFSLLGGDLNQGFSIVTAQLWNINQSFPVKITGSLPAAPKLPELYQRWRLLYEALLHRLDWHPRMKIHSSDITNISVSEFTDVCQQLQTYINQWLNSEPFQNIEQQLRTQLNLNDEIRVIIETDVSLLHHLPWHLWNFFADYRHAEVALSTQSYEPPRVLPRLPKEKVKILAIQGNSDGIDIGKDRNLLYGMADAQTTFLVEPTRPELNAQLWDQDWDILFFAGHSTSQPNGETGKIYINQTESITIPQLKNALQTAIARGLKLAIFNSCNGIGLARDLADLHIPQIIVMREPVPDLVAQEFLKQFLTTFAGGKSLYLAVREARERLEGLESEYPCASWLPVICQNPTVVPVTWQELCGRHQSKSDRKTHKSIWTVLLSSVIVGVSVLGLRYLGVFQSTELQSFDQMLRLRSQEEQDTRLLVVEITEKDIQSMRETTLNSNSISDSTLAKLIHKLQRYQPRVIGVDIYRDSPDSSSQSNPLKLATELSQNNIVAVCKGKDSKNDPLGIKPPAGVPSDRQGFTDGIPDPDGIVRRQILMMAQEPSSPCATSLSLSLQLATRYLFYEDKGNKQEFTGDFVRFGSSKFQRLKVGRSGAYQQSVNLGGIQILVNYHPADDYQKVTLTDVLSNKNDLNLVRNRVILIGVTANTTSGGDTWPTPYSAAGEPYQRTPGVLIQAHMVSQILSAVLDRRPILWVLPYWGDILLIAGCSLIGGVIVWRIRLLPGQGCAIVATVIVLYGVCAAILLIQGAWLPFIPSAFAIIVNGTTVLVLKQSHKDVN